MESSHVAEQAMHAELPSQAPDQRVRERLSELFGALVTSSVAHGEPCDSPPLKHRSVSAGHRPIQQDKNPYRHRLRQVRI